MASRSKTLLKLDKVNKNSSMGSSFYRQLYKSQQRERRIEGKRDRRSCDSSDKGCTKKGISRRVFSIPATKRVAKKEQAARLTTMARQGGPNEM